MGNRLHLRELKFAAEKSVRQLMKRREVLRSCWRVEDRVRVPMEKPVFWGYRRHLILRKDIASRKDAKQFLELLAIVQKEEDCRRKDFKRWDKQTRKWEVWNHTPIKLNPSAFRKLPDHLKGFFERYQHKDYGAMYRVTCPWWFESRRRKLYLTHRFLPNVEREQEESYIDAMVEQRQLWGTFRKLKSHRSYAWGHWNDGKRKLQEEMLTQEIGDALEIHAAGELGMERGKEVNENA